MYREVLLAASICALPISAAAQDLGEAISYVEGAVEHDLVGDWRERSVAEEGSAMPMLTSRDVEPNAALDTYRCANGMIDGDYTLRTSGEMAWAGRRCREMRFAKDTVVGFESLGAQPLRPGHVERWADRAAAETDVPAVLLVAIARHMSGFRAEAVSDTGKVGLMQLSPSLLRNEGINPGNLKDGQNNIRKGAEYIRQLTLRLGGLKLALAAYLNGPQAVADAGGVPGDADTIWFVREMMRLYYASIREFPNEFGTDNIAFVWRWMD